MTMGHPSCYRHEECASEILVQASYRLGQPIRKNGGAPPSKMNIADAIADCSINNARGALDAFSAMHQFTGADDLKAWQVGKSYPTIAAVMRAAALCVRK
jgi:hypothetical protein